MNGVRAFREAYTSTDLVYDETDYGDFDGRKMRYTLYWSYYENSAYRKIHKWAHQFKATYGLYKYTRSIYNPAYRLGEFWKAHLWGGSLDVNAGDGVSVPSALPIITDSQAIRPAIAKLWRDSNWQIKKDVTTLWGSVMGDAVIKIVDDTVRKKVYLKNVHPATLKSVTLDPFGNVKEYEIEERRPDPDKAASFCLYREVAQRVGDAVVYSTYKDNALYSWDDGPAEWAEPYGFTPLILIKHNDVGTDWGWSEFHSAQSKFREVDDIASKLSDQIRKMVDAPWLLVNVSQPRKDERQRKAMSEADAYNPEPGREEIPVYYGTTGADAKPLVANLDITASLDHIKRICENLEQDHPELSVNIQNVSGSISGRALRANQEPAKNKVQQRRPNYDNALVRAHQMALAIGGFRGYDGYSGFDLESYAKGQLDHMIGEREVFSKDPLDDLEYEVAFWKTVKEAKANGIPIEMILRDHGWSEDRIKTVINSVEHQARIASLQQISAMNTGSQEGDNNSIDTTGGYNGQQSTSTANEEDPFGQ